MSRYEEMSKGHRNKMFILYIIFLFLLAMSIMLMPMASEMKQKTMLLTYLAGGMFWIGVIGTVYMDWRINHCRKSNYHFNKQNPNMKQLGLVHFFKNKFAIVADVTMFVSIIGFVMAKLSIETNLISFVFLAIFVFSFGMHCMLNGINYEFIKYKVRREEVYELHEEKNA